jgi:hypothetical protein
MTGLRREKSDLSIRVNEDIIHRDLHHIMLFMCALYMVFYCTKDAKYSVFACLITV